MTYSEILVDTSLIVAYYDVEDKYHDQACNFFASCSSKLVTTIPCFTEVMWLLASKTQLQNNFLFAVANKIYEYEPLLLEDFTRIAELNAQYADLPGDECRFIANCDFRTSRYCGYCYFGQRF